MDYRPAVAINIGEIINRGGRELIDFLDYCVRSVQMDPLFLFLVREYRNHPTTPKAVTLYEIFCAPDAPARTSDPSVLPPLDLRIETAIRPLKMNLTRVQAAQFGASDPPPPLLLPAKFLFDFIVAHLEETSESLRQIAGHYKPHRTPLENIPGGRMTAGQKVFVDKVWEPKLRPWLVAAGFTRVASIA
jgi:hypothetical protein